MFKSQHKTITAMNHANKSNLVTEEYTRVQTPPYQPFDSDRALLSAVRCPLCVGKRGFRIRIVLRSIHNDLLRLFEIDIAVAVEVDVLDHQIHLCHTPGDSRAQLRRPCTFARAVCLLTSQPPPHHA